jgi:hypothetical protein
MLATGRGLGLRTACGKAPRKDLYARERDSVDVVHASNCGRAQWYAKADEGAVKDSCGERGGDQEGTKRGA